MYALTSFSDVFKKGFIENFNSDLSIGRFILTMVVSLLIGVLICVVYRISYRGVLFSRAFCVSLLAMNVITTLILLTITSNVVLSLGMVGALSIIRFRTAIKDPLDIVFLYYAICAGIMCGAQLLLLAVLGTIIVGAILVIASRLPAAADSFILMISVNPEDEEPVVKYIEKSTKRSKLKSKALVENTVELSMEVTLIAGSTKFLNKLNAYPGVSSVTLVKSTGEYI
ncbi:MAG: DUF4956 domain-containing protein [Clostridia bacterium]|jgi:uncharacterized membrane protein YhiD involved in acid resistance|nr:DUF4956 domain-containing protein [Clostridia bacterium]